MRDIVKILRVRVVKSKISSGYVLTHGDKYRVKSGGYYHGYEYAAARDPDAKIQSLGAIKEDLSILGYDISDLPARWPRGEESIVVNLHHLC